MLDELKEIMSNLYIECGLTDNVVRLSQLVDRLVYQEQVKRG